jgi:hypothetical protein
MPAIPATTIPLLSGSRRASRTPRGTFRQPRRGTHLRRAGAIAYRNGGARDLLAASRQKLAHSSRSTSEAGSTVWAWAGPAVAAAVAGCSCGRAWAMRSGPFPRDDEAELVAVVLAAVGERRFVKIFSQCGVEPAGLAVEGDVFALKVAGWASRRGSPVRAS